jgi:NAD dependent epimerase/dehydratase family enzyme
VLHRPAFSPIPRFAVEMIAGEMAGPALFEKQRALPRAAQALGYQFHFPELEPALRDIVSQR